MGVFDKIKNALFEEEYVEVEEKPKTKSKPKKEKIKKDVKESTKVHETKPIAKKIVLPEKTKEEPLEEELDDYVPTDRDFEIAPERDVAKEEADTHEFKFPAVEDQELKEESYYAEPKIVEVVENKEVNVEDYSNLYHGRREEVHHEYREKEEPVLYQGGKEHESAISIREYGGAYEKKETKTGFKPSPIISPIYGILDKNYKKEEIVPKKEVRLTSYAKEHMSVDDVRRKAYGNLDDDIVADIEGYTERNEKQEEKISEEDNLLVDLSDDAEKPSVSEITMGDAEEYFRDLGLEYNIDYKDSSKERATGRRVTEDYDEKEKSITTSKEVGEKVGVSRQAINAIETGKFDPSIWLAYDLAKLFDLSIEELFDFEGGKRK